MLTRLGGPVFALNPDLIERADATPDTVITLVDGAKYIVTESVAELIGLIREYRASVIHEARSLDAARATDRDGTEPPTAGTEPAATSVEVAAEVVQLHRREC